MNQLLVLLLGSTVAASAFAQDLPHMDLEMSSNEYRAILAQQTTTLKALAMSEGPVEEALKYGNRMSAWISILNEGRPEQNAVRITSQENRIGYTVSKPNLYSVRLIKERTEAILSELPAEMKTALLDGANYPKTLKISQQEFNAHARKIDLNYQIAARYTALNPFKSTFRSRAYQDMRGLVYLKENKITEKELEDVSKLPVTIVPEIKKALGRICRNDSSMSVVTCTALVEDAFAQNKVKALYETSVPKSQKVWDSFFTISNKDIRRDVEWTEKEMWVPFVKPDDERFEKYLSANIEKEYKWKDWGLKLDFAYWRKGPKLKFEKGVMPHVSSVGGNVITMDSNQPIEEFESQWIIRHEFGHVIGLPDCYHEFYDDEEEAYVSYQLDTTDLMCSRAGNMNERIYKELKRVYE